MAVALDYLVRRQLDPKAEFRTNLRFQLRGDVCMTADRTRYLADSDVIRRQYKPRLGGAGAHQARLPVLVQR
jgi:hypothetical protein